MISRKRVNVFLINTEIVQTEIFQNQIRDLAVQFPLNLMSIEYLNPLFAFEPKGSFSALLHTL